MNCWRKMKSVLLQMNRCSLLLVFCHVISLKNSTSLVHLTPQLKMSLISLGFALKINFLYSCTCVDYLYGIHQIKIYLSCWFLLPFTSMVAQAGMSSVYFVICVFTCLIFHFTLHCGHVLRSQSFLTKSWKQIWRQQGLNWCMTSEHEKNNVERFQNLRTQLIVRHSSETIADKNLLKVYQTIIE